MRGNLIGLTIGGKYRLQEIIGQGGMGIVYRGQDRRDKTDYAVKMMPSSLQSDANMTRRFKREAHTLSQLRHPHIVRLYDFGLEKGFSYIVMAHLTGGTLEQRIRHCNQYGRGLPSLGETLTWASQVASALQFAAARGITHRDIKPSNIMFDAEGKAYLVDFGVARLSGSSHYTATGAAVGTPLYMPPEQWRNDDKIDQRADIYALAAVIYHVLAGVPPFQGDSPETLLYQHLEETPQPIQQYRTDIPSRVDVVLQRALSKKPEDRYGSFDAFIQDLQGASSIALGMPTGFMTFPLPESASTASETRSNSWLQAITIPTVPRIGWSGLVAGLALLIALIGAVLLIIGLAAPRPRSAPHRNSPPAQAVEEENTPTQIPTLTSLATDTPPPATDDIVPTLTPAATRTKVITKTPIVTPTVPPTVTPVGGVSRLVSTSDVNVRQGDSTNHPVIGVLRANTWVSVLAISNTGSGWFQIQMTNGLSGWVAPSVVRFSGNVDTLTRVSPPPAPSSSGSSSSSSSTDTATAAATDAPTTAYDCSNFAALSPQTSLVNGNNVFSWSPASGIHSYWVSVQNEKWESIKIVNVPANTTSVNVDLQFDNNDGQYQRWQVTAQYGNDIVCDTEWVQVVRGY